MNVGAWKNENWFASQYNFLDEVRRGMQIPEKVFIHDITLRDGEQQANIILRKHDKLKIARMLNEVGVNRIEAGMPAVSKEEKEAVKAIAKEGFSAKVFSFARCMKRDIDLALDCDVDGVIMEIPSSDHLLKHAYGWTVEKAINLSVEATTYAGEHGLHVAFFTIDSTRSNFDVFWNIIDRVYTEGHMDSYVLVDTFGVCSPEAISYLVKEIKKRTNKPIEMHCHNDLGLGVANSLAGVLAGAEIVHTTVNAIGERNGNAALEEVSVSLEVLYGVKTDVNIKKLKALSKLVEDLSLVKMPPHKPIVGDNTFTTESGIVAGWWDRASRAKKPLEVFPFSTKFLGYDNVKIVLGKGSGKASIIYKLKELGFDIPPKREIDKIIEKVKVAAEEKKRVLTESEFRSIVKEIS